jgi:hypothetical protein
MDSNAQYARPWANCEREDIYIEYKDVGLLIQIRIKTHNGKMCIRKT